LRVVAQDAPSPLVRSSQAPSRAPAWAASAHARAARLARMSSSVQLRGSLSDRRRAFRLIRTSTHAPRANDADPDGSQAHA
jgi:hypothetical protein